MGLTIQVTGGRKLTLGFPVPVGSGEANDATNVGTGEGVFRDKTGATLNLKSITGSSGVVVTSTADEIDVAGPSSLGDVVGPAGATDGRITVFDDATGKLIKEPDGDIDAGGQAIANVGNVDGRDVSADGTAADTHIADLTNPHSVTAAQAGADATGTAATAVSAHEAAGDPHPTYTTVVEAAAAAPVQSVNTATGAVVLGAGDVGADPAGTAATAVSAHEAAGDPHPTYTNAAEAALAAPVQDVNGEVGNVVLNATDVGADATGTAATAVSAHEALYNHPGIPTTTQKAALDAAAAPSGGNPFATIADLPAASTGDVVGPAGAVDSNIALFDGATGKLIKDGGQALSDFVDISDLTTHVTDTTNPHAVTAAQALAIPTAEKGAANGVATLDAGGLIPNGQLPPLAISNTFVVVSEVAQLALVAEIGDVAIRTDIGRSFILRTTPPSAIGAWEEIIAPGTGITSVNGQSGPVVSLDTDDVSEGGLNLYYEEARVSANADVAANTAHRSSTANPHATDIGNLGAGTLAELNTKVSDATLDDSGDSRPPNGAASGDLAGTYPGPTVVAASETVAGKIEIATQVEVDAGTDDIRAVTPLKLANTPGPTAGFYNGTILETFDALATSDGATVTMSLEQSGGGDLTMRFSDGNAILDCTPAATVAITAGSDTAPTENYVYIPQSTKVLTVSTSDWPAAEHIKVAYFLVPSAAFVQADGCYVNQNWNDHNAGTNGQGHLSHLTEHIRLTSRGAVWHEGAATAVNITTNVGTPDNVDVAVTAGVAFQAHRHSTPAIDTGAGGEILVVNDSVTPYKQISDLNGELTDADGNIMSGRFFNLVIWAVANKTGEYTPLMVNLPTGSYNSLASAVGDVDNEDVYTIPTAFALESATGFLLARVTLKHSVASGGTWTLEDQQDLRGQLPGAVSGVGGGISTTEFADNQFRVFDDGDPTKQMAFQASGITTGNTRTYTVPDADGVLGVLTANTPADVTDSAGAVGTGTDTARDDHAHAHGNRGGGSLHALAIAAGAAGFMSGVDKTKLDSLVSGSWTYSASESRETMTSDVPQVKTSLVTPATSGTFLVLWTAALDAANKPINVDLYNSTDTATLQAFKEGPSVTTHRISTTGFAVVTLTGASKTLQIRWYNDSGKSDTMGISQARIGFLKVA